MTISNVLASRYASEEMVKVWNAENKIILERELWLAVLQAQKDLGQQVPDGVIDDYKKFLIKSTLIQYMTENEL